MTVRFDGFEVNQLAPRLTDRAFERFCIANPKLRIEQDKNGNIIVMPPTSYESGSYEADTITVIGWWNLMHKLGRVFSSSTMFTLPDGAKRMPDVAWVSNEKDRALTEPERKTFARIVPDFVAEVRSPSDSVAELKEKIRSIWMTNGVRLAWLLDPEDKKAWIFRADGSETEVPDFHQKLSGEDVLPGFELDLQMFLR